ncbi:MAG TPA: hypothetical protein VGE59_02830 [Patescibacteria group bacterium]
MRGVLAFLLLMSALLAGTPARAHERKSSSLSFGLGFSYSQRKESYSRPRRDYDRRYAPPYQRPYVDPGPPLSYYGRDYDPYYDPVPQPRYIPERGYSEMYYQSQFGYSYGGFSPGYAAPLYGGYTGYSRCPCCGMPLLPTPYY